MQSPRVGSAPRSTGREFTVRLAAMAPQSASLLVAPGVSPCIVKTSSGRARLQGVVAAQEGANVGYRVDCQA